MAQRYSRDFKVQGLELLKQPGMTVAQAARDLGLAQSQLYTWRRTLGDHGAAAFVGKGNLLPHDQELRRLKRENERLRMERDILKKATVFFAKEGTRG